MQPITLTHSDEVSGITILSDGTRVYWGEGGADSVVITPDGNRTVIGPYRVHPLQKQLDDAMANMREMTPDEEQEYETVMYGNPIEDISNEMDS